MITSDAFAGGLYAVLGLARSGLATVDALVASGARVVAWDASAAAREAFLSRRPGEGRDPGSVPLGPGFRRGDLDVADPLQIDLAGFDAIVVSPGVPLNRHPIAARARDAGVPVIGDIELFARARAALPAHCVVGITGTNGKSTTTALIHHMLVTAGIPATLGGNIGLPILGQDPLPAGGVYVLELSSYQIDLTQSLDCDVAVLLNITPDHLDRYDGFAAYAASKARLFAMQAPEHVAVIATEDEETRAIARTVRSHLNEVAGGGAGDQATWPTLQGPHNAQNAAAAIAAARALHVPEQAIAQGLRSYPGLPHRMERVREKDGVLYVNDSKATNPTSAAPALAAFPDIHWILGGRAKTDELDACMDNIGHVRAAYTIGEAGPLFAGLLGAHVPVTQSQRLPQAVRDAAAAARAGDTVLLSPACASFDQFADYEARGTAFRAAVEGL